MDWTPVLLAALSYAVVWFLFMGPPGRRSFRSVLFLTLTSLPLALAPAARFPVNLAVIAIVTAVWAVGLWDLNHLLAPMEPAEMRFDEHLRRIQRTVMMDERRLRVETWDQERAAHLEVLTTALRDLSALTPPTPEWGRLQARIVRALEFDADVYRGERRADTATGGASHARWEQIAREWSLVWAARSRFMR